MALPETPVTRTEQYLDAIARGVGGGGSSLPTVTSDDNGDVLTVVEGAWDKAAPSGGGGGTSAFVVHVVLNLHESGNSWVPTVTEPIADIIEALDADIPVVAHCGKSYDGETPSGYFVISLLDYYPAETVADVGIDFVYTDMDVNDASTTLYRYWLYWYSNSWVYEEKTATVVSQ